MDQEIRIEYKITLKNGDEEKIIIRNIVEEVVRENDVGKTIDRTFSFLEYELRRYTLEVRNSIVNFFTDNENNIINRKGNKTNENK